MKQSSFIFWLVTLCFLLLYFGSLHKDYIQAFYFVTALAPVAIGTTYTFSQHLLPKLIAEQHQQFATYLVTTIILSLGLEYLILKLSLSIFQIYQIEGFNEFKINLFQLGVVLYLIVLSNAFIQLFYTFREKKNVLQRREKEVALQSSYIEKLEREKEQSEITHIQIRANRRIHQVELTSVLYIESVGDYVKFVLEKEEELKSKMKISHLAEELPAYFLRIHRAFLVNRNKIEQYSREKLYIHNTELPISRTYRKEVQLQLANHRIPL